MQGKVAIVTGASRGIGKAVAIGFAKEGAKVVVAARTVEPRSERLPGTIHETVEAIEKLGGQALAVQCDVTDETASTPWWRLLLTGLDVLTYWSITPLLIFPPQCSKCRSSVGTWS